MSNGITIKIRIGIDNSLNLFLSGEFIIGRVIKAMMSTWHPQCFTCEMCHKELADLGFIKNQGKATFMNISNVIKEYYDINLFSIQYKTLEI